MGKLTPIKLPPGMFRNGTRYETAGRYYTGNLVRWENGRLKPIGGWVNIAPGTVLTGVARGGLSFIDDLGFSYTLVGTNSNLYTAQADVFTDQTPTDFVGGEVDSVLGNGYGAGPYGAGTYGTPRSSNTLQLLAATWQFDTFGDEAVMVSSSDKKIRIFDPTTGLVTTAANSPTATAVMATNEDFLLAIGAGGNARLIQWPDVGTTDVWTPLDTNAAGSINLNTNGIGMAGARVGLQNLVWTNVDVHLVNYVGQPGIYAPIRIGTACGLVGPRAWVVAASGASGGEAAYWMSAGGFFQFNGVVTPLMCDVQDFLWRNINFTQAAKIYASVNARFHEVTWFFPSLASLEVDSYVTFNYKEGVWYFGIGSSLARTTFIDRGAVAPIGISAAGIVYEHEIGYLADGVSRVGQVFAATGSIEIGDGDRVMYCNMALIDGDGLLGSDGLAAVSLQTQTARNPQDAAVLITTPLQPNKEGYTPLRFEGRQVNLRFDILKDQDWSIGKLRFDLTQGGGR
jgi:hypothetical protein